MEMRHGRMQHLLRKNNPGGSGYFSDGFSFISYTLHPIALSKQMYLCPLAVRSGKADYRKIPFQGGTAYDGLHSRHGSGSVYDTGRTVLVSAYFME